VQNNFNIVLFEPEIPGNTGSIGRTCVALNLRLILIKPYGFDIDEKAVRRAGLDYWKYVNLTEYDSFTDFLQGESPSEEQLFFFENDGSENYYQADFKKDCYLIFGAETKGLSKEIYKNYHHRMFYLPMYSEHIRSLNLSNTATTVAYEALRKIKF
tara:strand:- start:11104 stop:11571 length:468 start_codon:yes stop_codon:yes gene_type:complete